MGDNIERIIACLTIIHCSPSHWPVLGARQMKQFFAPTGRHESQDSFLGGNIEGSGWTCKLVIG